MKREGRGCLARLAAAMALIVLLGALLFAAYCWRVMRSDAIASSRADAGAYSCIGSTLDARRPQFYPELQLARRYLLEPDGGNRMRLTWHFELALTTRAIDAFTARTEANRMYASLPRSPFMSFDHVARSYAGIGYCELDQSRRQAIVDFYWSGTRFPIDAAMQAEPGA